MLDKDQSDVALGGANQHFDPSYFHPSQIAVEASEVETYAKEMGCALVELRDVVGQMESRLHLILKPEVARQESPAPQLPPSSMSAVGGAFRDGAREVVCASARLRVLMQRLAV